MKDDLGNIREAHLILARQIEKIDSRLNEVVDTVTTDALRRSEELTSEVHSLEDAVQRMAEQMEAQLSSRVAAAPPGALGRGPQSVALLDTVKDALAGNRVDLYLQPVVSLAPHRLLRELLAPAR
jgi:cyclic-di-GMP phosphodiesterase TipF (flagellum assembly factor)